MDTNNAKQNASHDTRLESFMKQSIKRKRLKRLIFIPIALALALIFFVICFVFFFKVKTVSVEGAQKYSPDLLIIKSGIIAGENLYAYSEAEIEETLMLNYPYISNVELKRRWPDKIILEITEDVAAYTCEVYGETLILSKDLRILENPDADVKSIELCMLVLPDIDRALVGSFPVFSQSADYINDALKSINSSKLRKSITSIDFRNKYGVTFLMGNTYKVKCGSSDELDIKLVMTEKILESNQIPEGVKAELDVSNPAECTAILGDSANIEL
ncbi:MAG: FtsQ-type POTRA domain-containing protein [Clostridia bacterium]|nr:FtsQ-type POTRA domain-containing protein [Clostridia bacterium]